MKLDIEQYIGSIKSAHWRKFAAAFAAYADGDGPEPSFRTYKWGSMAGQNIRRSIRSIRAAHGREYI